MTKLFEQIHHSHKAKENKICFRDLNGHSVSYREVFAQAKGIAQFLVQKGVSEELVPLLSVKNIPAAIGLIGILEAGCAYIPLDIALPSSRLEYILENAGASCMLIHNQSIQSKNGSLLKFIKEMEPIPGTDLLFALLWNAPEISYNIKDEDLAYVLYTSGSTGSPKGVKLSNKNALCFVNWCWKTFNITSDDVILSVAPFHFDLSIFDLYTGLSSGAEIVLTNQKEVKNPLILSEALEKYRITTWYATPTILKMVDTYGKTERYDHSSLRNILFAGEVFPISHLKKAVQTWHTARFYNLYGPTETNVCTYYPIPEQITPDQNIPFPIGKVCPYDQGVLLDGESLIPLKSGSQGELLVTGESVTPGYLGLENLNRKVFVIDDNGKQWYRTGDKVVVNEDGDLVYTGRIDRMIKRRGYRIELDEIENALVTHPSVQEARVVSRYNEKDDVEIIAFVEMEEGTKKPGKVELNEHCMNYIPQYMLADKYRNVDSFPMTSSNKIDYSALKALIGLQ